QRPDERLQFFTLDDRLRAGVVDGEVSVADVVAEGAFTEPGCQGGAGDVVADWRDLDGHIASLWWWSVVRPGHWVNRTCGCSSARGLKWSRQVQQRSSRRSTVARVATAPQRQVGLVMAVSLPCDGVVGWRGARVRPGWTRPAAPTPACALGGIRTRTALLL